MIRTTNYISPILLTLLCGTAYADDKRMADLDLTVVDSDIQPSVTIQEHSNRVVEEYRVNNNLYMMKVTPSIGAPYYLVDQDGSGDMEYRRSAYGGQAPQWTLFSW